MNDASPVTRRWKCPTAWQWLVIAWLVALNASPYAVGVWAAYGFRSINWMLWSMLSGPFAHTGMLAFFLIAGGLPPYVRRLTFFVSQLAMLTMLMLIFDEQTVGTVAWLMLEAATLLTLTLASAWLLGVPAKPRRWFPQFSLAEILALTVLLGILLYMLRLSEVTTLEYWRQAQDLAFTMYTVYCGIYLFVICQTTILRNRIRLIAMIVACLLLWIGFPWILLGTLILLDPTRPVTYDIYLNIYYPALAIQLVLAWGTLFPLRIWFPGVLQVQPHPEVTLVAASNGVPTQIKDEQDFVNLK